MSVSQNEKHRERGRNNESERGGKKRADFHPNGETCDGVLQEERREGGDRATNFVRTRARRKGGKSIASSTTGENPPSHGS